MVECLFEPHRRHCVVCLSKNINPSLVLVQPRKTRPFITERLLMGRKESNQTNKNYLNYCVLEHELVLESVLKQFKISIKFSVAPDLVLHCLLMSPKMEARLI